MKNTFKKLLKGQINRRLNSSDAEDNTELERVYNYHLNQRQEKIPPYILHPDFGLNEENKGEKQILKDRNFQKIRIYLDIL